MKHNKFDIQELKSFQEDTAYCDGDLSKWKGGVEIRSRITVLSYKFLGYFVRECGECYSKAFKTLSNIDISRLY